MNYIVRITLMVSLTIMVLACSKIDFDEMSTLPVTPYNELHSLKKQQIINYLTRLCEVDSLIVGQNIGHADGSLNFGHIDNLPKKPGVLAFDLGYDDYNRSYTDLLNYIQNFANQSGIITMSFHMPNPHNRKDVHNQARFDFEDIYAEGSKTNKNFKILLNNIGNFIQQLKDRNIILLLRPFHEMNGGWFWWGNNRNWPTKVEFSAMWVYTFEYFYNERQLDNILWVYSPNYQYSTDLKTGDYYYPGNEYVDIVGMDYYKNDLSRINDNNSLAKLILLGKPIVICEIGPQNSQGEFDNNTYKGLIDYPEIAYFVAWHSWEKNKWAIEDNQNAESLLNDELVLTLDELVY